MLLRYTDAALEDHPTHAMLFHQTMVLLSKIVARVLESVNVVDRLPSIDSTDKEPTIQTASVTTLMTIANTEGLLSSLFPGTVCFLPGFADPTYPTIHFLLHLLMSPASAGDAVLDCTVHRAHVVVSRVLPGVLVSKLRICTSV